MDGKYIRNMRLTIRLLPPLSFLFVVITGGLSQNLSISTIDGLDFGSGVKNYPIAITTDTDGNLIVTNYYMIWRVNINVNPPTKEIIVGSTTDEVSYREGTGADARFSFIADAIVLNGTHILVTDSNNWCVRLIDLQTKATSTYAGKCKDPQLPNNQQATIDGNRLAARFSIPQGMALATNAVHIYMVDNIYIRRLDLNRQQVDTLHTYSTILYYIAINGRYLYLTHQLGIVRIGLDDNVETFTTSFQSESFNGNLASTQFNFPKAIISLNDDLLAVADRNNNKIRIIDLKRNITLAICSGAAGVLDGNRTNCELYRPRSLHVYNGMILTGARSVDEVTGSRLTQMSLTAVIAEVARIAATATPKGTPTATTTPSTPTATTTATSTTPLTTPKTITPTTHSTTPTAHSTTPITTTVTPKTPSTTPTTTTPTTTVTIGPGLISAEPVQRLADNEQVGQIRVVISKPRFNTDRAYIKFYCFIAEEFNSSRKSVFINESLLMDYVDSVSNNLTYYISGKITPTNNNKPVFSYGDRKYYGRYHNAPLNREAVFKLHYMIQYELGGETFTHIVESSEIFGVKILEGFEFRIEYYIIIEVAAVIIIIIIIILCKRRSNTSEAVRREADNGVYIDMTYNPDTNQSVRGGVYEEIPEDSLDPRLNFATQTRPTSSIDDYTLSDDRVAPRGNNIAEPAPSTNTSSNVLNLKTIYENTKYANWPPR